MLYKEIKPGESYLFQEKEIKVIRKSKEISFDIDKNKDVEYRLEVANKGGDTCAIVCINDNFDRVKPLKPKLPETGLVVSHGYMVVRTGKNSGYGFKLSTGEYLPPDNDWVYTSEDRPATKEDEKRWKELLEKECVKRGFIRGVKVKSLDKEKVYTLDGGTGHNITQLNWFWLSTINGENIMVMKDGKWAEIVKNEKYEEDIKELLEKPIGHLSLNQIQEVLNHINSFTK